MLKSELSKLEACVGIILNDNEIIQGSNISDGRDSLYGQFNAACTALRQQMISEVFGPAKDHVIRRYVQFHQAGLTMLSDLVFQQLKKAGDPLIPGKSGLLVRALDTLQELLDFTGRQFYPYFDRYHAISHYASDLASTHFRSKIEMLAPLLERQPVDQALITAFFLSMEECLDQLRYQPVTYEQVNYMDRLLKHIQLQLTEQSVDTKHFAGLLYRYNFNSTYFEGWYRKYLLSNHGGTLADHGSSPAIEPVIQPFGISANRKPIDVLLREWAAVVGPNAAPAKRVNARESKLLKLPLVLSVPQLALFVRLCYLDGCFQISNISHIMRFFTGHFESKKQSQISLKSFNHAFYTSDQGTAAIVRDFLRRMIIIIDKTYFPQN